MPYINVAGVRAFYSRPDSLSHGKVVIMVHGARGNHKVWRPQIESLSEDHTPIAIDLPGHGQSGGRGSTSVEEYREFLEALIDGLGLDRFVLAGHSLGGSIALSYTLGRSDAEGLVLVGSGASWDVPMEYIDLWRSDPDKALREGVKRNFPPETPQSIVDYYLSEIATAGPEVGAGDLLAGNSFDIRSRLKEIEVPTQIICGDQDMFLHKSMAMNSAIEGSRFDCVKSAGHYPTIEQPEATNQILRRFLDSLD